MLCCPCLCSAHAHFKSHLLPRDSSAGAPISGASSIEMHACFHGGGGSAMKSINIIRDLAKNMKAMSLKVKAGDSGSHARARRRWRRRPEAEEDLQLQDKDIAAAAAAAASAKIAPAQVHEADDPPHGSDSHHPHKEEIGGKRQVHCDKWCFHLDDVAEEEEEEEAAAVATGHAAGEESDWEWVAEPEPGVLMTLVSRPDGTNHLRRLRFREELFDGPRAAQRWWADNYDSIVELYSIVQSGEGSYEDDAELDDQGDEPLTPCQSEDDHRQPRRWQRLGCDSASTSGPSSGSGGGSASTLGSPILGLVVATPKSSTRERGPGPGPGASDKCRSLHRN